MNQKSIYLFGLNITEGDGSMKNLLGGKGANLAEMSKIGMNVPPGFTITTEECNNYYTSKTLSEGLKKDILSALSTIEKVTQRKFGDKNNYPLLLSVRSGARASMPGMMDTILNLGLNDETVISLANATNNKRFSLDSYRRFIQMYSNVVLEIDHYNFEYILNDYKLENNITLDNEMNENHLEEVIELYKEYLQNEHNIKFPQDIHHQLFSAIEAVFKSWMNDRAIKYRSLYSIPDSWGTAVNVQSMVFGNLNFNSGTGVVFTRNPSTGVDEIYGEYLMNAQGEDVVAGIRNPFTIKSSSKDDESMENKFPKMFEELCQTIKKLETYYKDMQDVEFTIENGKLFILQTRNGKRSATSAIKIAHDLAQEGLITKQQAILMLDPHSIEKIMHPQIDESCKKEVIAIGLPASPGCAGGKIVFNSQTAEELSSHGEKVILVRHETSPEDIGGMHASEGILTACGGMTSHAAVVARGIGKPCVSGCNTLYIDEERKTLTIKNINLKEGDQITINGSNGEVILGKVATIEPKLSDEFYTILSWADEFSITKVRTNAETIEDCKTAIKFGAKGIGLARTEHMFFDKNRILNVRKMLLTENEKVKNNAIKILLEEQKNDFIQIFKVLNGLPINIRLLDPPLHEFIPKYEEVDAFCSESGFDKDLVLLTIKKLHETNPMLGHRGCRLGITNPEIYQMQLKAIFQAYVDVKKQNIDVKLELMMPLIINKNELSFLFEIVKNEAKIVENEYKITIDYQIGTMVELPSACMIADELASVCDYFSFGTNDLTQTCLGISRDDSSKFIPQYINHNIIPCDPFVSLNESVKKLIKVAVEGANSVKPEFKTGICGEHGGDIQSIDFCVKNKFHYVSCSPYRVPVAKISAAISSIKFSSLSK